MKFYIFHITQYDVAFFGAIFIGLTFALQLWFTPNINRIANRFLALALVVAVLWMGQILAIDIPLKTPLQFSAAFGPLLFFYVLKITRPEYKLHYKDLLHFSPLLLQLPAQVAGFQELNSVIQLFAFISVSIYLYVSHKLIDRFYTRLKFNQANDRYRHELRWLRRLLTVFGLFWLLWVPYAFADHFYYHNHLSIHAYYPLYLLLAITLIWIAASAHLRSKAEVPVYALPFKQLLPMKMKQKGTWLKDIMKTNLYYRDAELSLRSLADKLSLQPNELSRIINTTLNKSYNDFINEYRVADVVEKMQDPAYDRLTLIGIAFDAGFNSKSTFNRTFLQITGKSPAEFKRLLEKERPNYTLRPFHHPAGVISRHETIPKWSCGKLNRAYMFRNYLKIAWRNLIKNKTSSFINIGGLAVGIAVAMLIGLWIWDELSFDKYHQNYDRIAQVMQNKTANGTVNTGVATSLPVEEELRKTYGNNFTRTGVRFWTSDHILTVGDKNLSFPGTYVTSGIPEMFTLKMLKGSRNALKDPSSLLVSQSVAKALFGNAEPIGKMIRLDNQASLVVAGVYEDLPVNTTIHDLAFMIPWGYFTSTQQWLKRAATEWGEDSFQIYVQLADHTNIDALSEKIKDIKLKNGDPGEVKLKPRIFLQPMSKWHLYSEFKNGVNTGGAIEYVWLFGIIGIFVLLLACINFMNLSTARSEKRAKEVGIRKAVGSLRGQLISQFFCESLLIALIAFALSLLLVWLTLPFFNDIAFKQMSVLWDKPLFWLMGIGFTLFAGIIAGSYPALYLSAFQPVKVLKGTFKAGPLAAIPRKVLVVLQFTVSITLIVGTIVIFDQVQFAKNRPVGYTRAGLIQMSTARHQLDEHFDVLRQDLIRSGAVTEVTESSSSTTEIHNNKSDVTWVGKDPAVAVDFAVIRVTTEYGKTLGWQFKNGRDFSTKFLTDSSGVVLNEAAVKYMGLKDPVGKTISFGYPGTTFNIIGVIKDMVMTSPYEPVKQTIFYIGDQDFDSIIIKINPAVSAHDAISKIGAIFKAYAPAIPFSYQFVDDEYAKKFNNEERIGKLASSFAGLAIFISCLGLFGMATFMAEQRIKEIGVRKVLGASVFGLWRLMSKDFVILVIIALLIATPIAWYSMEGWLKHYPYHAQLSWWIFVITAAGAVIITLLTVSYQAIKTALANPVKSLRSE